LGASDSGHLRATAHALVQTINARDFDALAQVMHPDLRFRSALGATEGQVYVGLAGLREWASSVDEVWDGYRVEIIDFREAGEERAVVVLHATGVGHGSGVPLDARLGQIWTWREGLLWRNESYTDAREALAAAGLTGDGPEPPARLRR